MKDLMKATPFSAVRILSEGSESRLALCKLRLLRVSVTFSFEIYSTLIAEFSGVEDLHLAQANKQLLSSSMHDQKPKYSIV